MNHKEILKIIKNTLANMDSKIKVKIKVITTENMLFNIEALNITNIIIGQTIILINILYEAGIKNVIILATIP